ncbi:MAG: L,D-transpeptidase family protein, partial [Chthoniobacterales bacterium]
NANAFNRCIYIHGTSEEKIIGKPASYGCVRMSSKDVTEVYAQIRIGALVRIISDSLPKLPKLKGSSNKVIFIADATAALAVKSVAKGKGAANRKHVSAAAKARTGSDA